MMPTHLPANERFWDKVAFIPFHECWEWTGATSGGKFSYGAIKTERGLIGAHRFSWELHNGPIPDGMLVCHKCDNPGCVNPDHLFLGTYLDNNRDCLTKGRGNKSIGERNPRTKLSPDSVRQIRDLLSSDMERKQIAKIFGVTHGAVYGIANGRNWRHLQ